MEQMMLAEQTSLQQNTIPTVVYNKIHFQQYRLTGSGTITYLWILPIDWNSETDTPNSIRVTEASHKLKNVESK
jgi:hypothetical protein